MQKLPDFQPAITAVYSELAHQFQEWGFREPDAYSGGGAFDRSLDEYTLYITRYADRLAAGNCRTAADFEEKVHTVRKIAALAVACLTQHGPLTREQEQAA